MYIFKNALRSITRNKGRNVLIGLIILVIAISATISLAILSSSNKLIDSYYEKNNITATIGVSRSSIKQNMDKDSMDEMRDNFNSISISLDDIKNYGDSEYVKSYYYEASTEVTSNELEVVSNNMEKRRPGDDKNSDEVNVEDQESNFTLKGYSSKSAMTEFIEGTYKITDGEADVSDEDSCIINDELASLNDLSVGDKVKVTYNDTSYEFTIVGIYEDNSTADRMNMFSNSSNQIIINIDKLNEINSDASLSPTYILNSIDDATKFSEEVEKKGLSEYLEVQNNSEEVESGINSITNIKTFVTTFLIIVLIIGAIVLFVINMINIRERKYEIGVLRTVGMSKVKLSIQFIVETLMVSLISLIIGALIGSLLSVKVSNYLLENEINSQSEKRKQINENFGMPGERGMPSDKSERNNNDKKMNNADFNSPTISTVNEINAVVDIKVLLQLLGIGILLSFISSLVAMINIQKFRPLKILQERS